MTKDTKDTVYKLTMEISNDLKIHMSSITSEKDPKLVKLLQLLEAEDDAYVPKPDCFYFIGEKNSDFCSKLGVAYSADVHSLSYDVIYGFKGGFEDALQILNKTLVIANANRDNIYIQ